MNRHSLAVLISGTGRNLQAIMAAIASQKINADLAVVISNRADAGGLQRASEAGIATEVVPHSDHADRESYDAALAATLQRYQPSWIALAGFMRVLTPGFVEQYQGRMLNIHPSLLPKYRGLHTHRRALEAGDKQHGASVHFVTPELDGGPVVLQGSTAIQSTDTEESLAQRIMQDIELRIYPQALAWATAGRLKLHNNDVYLDDNRLETPLQLNSLDNMPRRMSEKMSKERT
ncbi:MAG: phosphoribosylglycinamide formyltransferase [Salinisphaeraceae bacterium]|nr:phosphoribosylglycinamide formyltransferase [Salinisphaeraceae bacterium]